MVLPQYHFPRYQYRGVNLLSTYRGNTIVHHGTPWYYHGTFSSGANLCDSRLSPFFVVPVPLSSLTVEFTVLFATAIPRVLRFCCRLLTII